MDVQWTSLGEVSVVSLAVAVVVTVLFALGVAAWARGRDPHAAAPGGGRERAATGAALLCFAACLGAVVYGVLLIIPD